MYVAFILQTAQKLPKRERRLSKGCFFFSLQYLCRAKGVVFGAVALPVCGFGDTGGFGRRPFRAFGAEPKNAAGGAPARLQNILVPAAFFRAGRRPKSATPQQSIIVPPRQPASRPKNLPCFAKSSPERAAKALIFLQKYVYRQTAIGEPRSPMDRYSKPASAVRAVKFLILLYSMTRVKSTIINLRP